MGLALAYVVSPVDVMPEALMLLAGLGDDAVVLTWLAGAVLVGDRALPGLGGLARRPPAARRASPARCSDRPRPDPARRPTAHGPAVHRSAPGLSSTAGPRERRDGRRAPAASGRMRSDPTGIVVTEPRDLVALVAVPAGVRPRRLPGAGRAARPRLAGAAWCCGSTSPTSCGAGLDGPEQLATHLADDGARARSAVVYDTTRAAAPGVARRSSTTALLERCGVDLLDCWHVDDAAVPVAAVRRPRAAARGTAGP